MKINTPAQHIQHAVIYIMIYPFMVIIRAMPLPMAERVLSRIIGYIGPRIRKHKRLKHGLSIALPDLDDIALERLAQQNWCHYGINLAHTIHVDNPHLYKNTTVHGWEHFTTAHAQGQGVIILSAHIGVWDVVCATISHMCMPPDVVYRPLNNPYISRWFERRRLRVYNTLITKAPTAGRHILKSLRQGGVVPMMSDQKMWDGVHVPYFGVPAYTAPGAVVLGHKLNAPVIPMFAIYDAGTYTVFVEPPMTLTGDTYTDARHMNTIFERWVTQYPNQYFNFTHNRWG